jgi:hypothetical protein
MARKTKTDSLTDSIAGQYLSLAVAAHLARTQLVPDPLKVYDGQHLSEMLNVVAQALARTAPLQVTDAASGEKRPLTSADLEGALAKRGATALVLKDGRTLTGVSIRRTDLRQAIAILKAVGIPEFAPAAAAAPKPGGNGSGSGNGGIEALHARFAEIDRFLMPPLLPAQVEQAKAGAVWIARHAPHGRVANLAMQLMSALHETRGTEEIPGGFRMALARLRAALQDIENAGSPR